MTTLHALHACMRSKKKQQQKQTFAYGDHFHMRTRQVHTHIHTRARTHTQALADYAQIFAYPLFYLFFFFNVPHFSFLCIQWHL